MQTISIRVEAIHPEGRVVIEEVRMSALSVDAVVIGLEIAHQLVVIEDGSEIHFQYALDLGEFDGHRDHYEDRELEWEREHYRYMDGCRDRVGGRYNCRDRYEGGDKYETRDPYPMESVDIHHLETSS